MTTRVFDLESDVPIASDPIPVPDAAVLLLDGVFLLRPELRHHWTLSVHLDVSPATTLERALVRDLPVLGSEGEIRRRYEARYPPGQELYRRAAKPLQRADVVIDNTDPTARRLMSPYSADV